MGSLVSEIIFPTEMFTMTSKDLDKFKKVLLDERKRVESQIRHSAPRARRPGWNCADYDNHPADSASETY